MGDNIVIDVDASNPIENEIRDRHEVSLGQQRLIYVGKQLEDGRRVLCYKIEEESIQFVMLRLLGCVQTSSSARCGSPADLFHGTTAFVSVPKEKVKISTVRSVRAKPLQEAAPSPEQDGEFNKTVDAYATRRCLVQENSHTLRSVRFKMDRKSSSLLPVDEATAFLSDNISCLRQR